MYTIRANGIIKCMQASLLSTDRDPHGTVFRKHIHNSTKDGYDFVTYDSLESCKSFVACILYLT